MYDCVDRDSGSLISHAVLVISRPTNAKRAAHREILTLIDCRSFLMFI